MDRRQALARLGATAAGAALGGPALAARNAPAVLRVLSFNILAPLWAAPRWYPDALDPALLETAFRRERIVALLRAEGRTRDIVCLQEVEASEMPVLQQALGSGFVGSFAGHDPAYWSNWLVPDRPWVPNGNAVFVRRSAVTSAGVLDLPLGGTGNHAALLSAVLPGSQRPVRVASVHLDADRNDGRRVEFQALVAHLAALTPGVDLVAGDINEDTVSGSLGGEVRRAGFVDVLASVGNREATHPFSASYNGAPRWAIIDHVLARGATPRAGDVLDFGLWSLGDEVERIAANLRACGSDHFPVAGEVAV